MDRKIFDTTWGDLFNVGTRAVFWGGLATFPEFWAVLCVLFGLLVVWTIWPFFLVLALGWFGYHLWRIKHPPCVDRIGASRGKGIARGIKRNGTLCLRAVYSRALPRYSKAPRTLGQQAPRPSRSPSSSSRTGFYLKRIFNGSRGEYGFLGGFLGLVIFGICFYLTNLRDSRTWLVYWISGPLFPSLARLRRLGLRRRNRSLTGSGSAHRAGRRPAALCCRLGDRPETPLRGGRERVFPDSEPAQLWLKSTTSTRIS
jgi:hypothetical protein